MTDIAPAAQPEKQIPAEAAPQEPQKITTNLSKLSDEDIQKVLEDPRLWKTERLTGLLEKSKLASKLEKERKESEEKALTEQNKYKELAELKTKEAEELQQKFVNAQKRQALITEAIKHNPIDLEVLTQLVDLNKITIDESGRVVGIEDEVKRLVETKNYLFRQVGDRPSEPIGSPTSPTNPVQKFTLSQIQDPAFYQANEKAIINAMNTGQIVDDTR